MPRSRRPSSLPHSSPIPISPPTAQLPFALIYSLVPCSPFPAHFPLTRLSHHPTPLPSPGKPLHLEELRPSNLVHFGQLRPLHPMRLNRKNLTHPGNCVKVAILKSNSFALKLIVSQACCLNDLHLKTTKLEIVVENYA